MTIHMCSSQALDIAIRAILAPRGTLKELVRVEASVWAMSKELFVGRSLVERECCEIARLTNPQAVVSRAEWEAAFKIKLPRKFKWRRSDAHSRVAELQQRVAVAGGDVTGLRLREVLTLAMPVPTIGEGWGSPLSLVRQTCA